MRENIPANIVSDAQELTPRALVSLFKVALSSGAAFYLSPFKAVTWQGNLYEDVPCHMADLGQEVDGKLARPKFSFANPEGIFTSSVYNGLMDNAMITRIRLLKEDLEADNDFKITERFRVSKVLTVSRTVISVEMRDVLDGPNFQMPSRTYMPPEFPHVKI